MEAIRAYLDTSVFGGQFDVEFERPTRLFFEAVLAGRVVPLLSDTLAAEMGRAPEQVRALLTALERVSVEAIPLTAEALVLRDAYVGAGVLSRRFADDALHVAQATIARADVIVSWNFRHLVNPARVRQFNGVNVAQGYGVVVILTPSDLVRVLREASDELEPDGP